MMRMRQLDKNLGESRKRWCFLASLLHLDWLSESGVLGGTVLRGAWALPEAGPAPHRHPTACAW